MIFTSITIDYLNQLIRTGYTGAESILTELRTIGESFGASVSQRTSPLIMSFPDTRPYDLIQASEGISQTARILLSRASQLRGAALVVHQADSLDNAFPAMQTARFTINTIFGVQVTREGGYALRDYFHLSDSQELSSLQTTSYLSAIGNADASTLSDRPQFAEALGKACARIVRSDSRAVFIDAGHACRSAQSIERLLATMTPDSRIVNLGAPRTEPEEFSPFTQAISQELIEAAINSAASSTAARLSDLRSAFKLAASSRLSGSLPASAVHGVTEFINLLFDSMGAETPLLLCNSPERFSPEAVEIIGRRLADGRGQERYIILSSVEPPPSWCGSWLHRLALPVPADRDLRPSATALVEAALGNCGDEIRFSLTKRFHVLATDTSVEPGNAGLSEALDLLPREASLYLHELILAENVLEPEELSAFSGKLGLLPKGEALLQDLLKKAGLVDPADTRLPYAPMDANLVAASAGSETGTLLRNTYLSCLIDRYRAGSIRPSTNFLAQVGEQAQTASITFDCLFDDALRPDSNRPADTSFLSAPSACILDFWTALTCGDAETARAALARSAKSSEGPHAATIQALMRTELAYAEGNIEDTALGARSALLSHSKDSPPKLEARAHRMMGLTALASERYADASDYLSNAQELAETAGDHYERMMSAYAKAITEFMTGSLVRSTSAADQAAVSAGYLFRMDGLGAIESLRGRIDLELGDYDKAAERYSRLEALGTKYSLPGVPARARIWQGRALAYAGDFSSAERILEPEAADTEARIFLGEMAILRGRPRDARTWLDRPVRQAFPDEEPTPVRQRPFRPSDRFEWSSPFAEIEGRCIDFASGDTPLADLELALTLFATGLDERDAGCAESLHNLTRSRRAAKANPGMGTYCFFCYLLEERLPDPPVDKVTVLSRAFKVLQQRAGRIENRIQREQYMEKNVWNRRLLEAARTHKFI
ncbi:MAG: tetratricopeptide repeat protein [Clostridia bacterium]